MEEFEQISLWNAYKKRNSITFQKNNSIITEILKMDSNLMHSSGMWFASNDAGFAVVREAFKLGSAFLSFGRNSANSNFIADNLDRFVARDIFTIKSK